MSSGRPDSRPSASDHRSSLGGSAGNWDGAARLRAPRSLPPWIDSYEARYGAPADDQLQVLASPPRAVPPQHNNAPSPPQRRVSKDGYEDWGHGTLLPAPGSKSKIIGRLTGRRGAERGRKWDHLRSAEPVIVPGSAVIETASPWRTFLHSSQYGHMPNEEAQIVDPSELDELQPGLNKPLDLPGMMDEKRSGSGRTAALSKRIWLLILRHPLVPLAFRLTVLFTSIIALALSARIYELSRDEGISTASRYEAAAVGAQRSQAIVAVVVDTIAIPYIGYMTWDEYTGKPLGLRRATAKISLTLLDLFFIILKSASTSLAFESLVYHGVDAEEVRFASALAAFQTVSLISWTMTFSVNVFRLVVKLGGVDDEKIHHA